MVELSSTIQCKTRTQSGRGHAHKMRATGMVPAVAYGPGRGPSLLALDPILFGMQKKSYGTSFIYDVEIEGQGGFKALIKDVQVDPLSRKILHVDLYAVDMAKPIRVEVPIELCGKAAGVTDGGLLSQLLRAVEVQCLPDRVPARLTVDVSALNIGQVLHTDAIVLPEGVVITAKRAEAVAAVIEPEEEEAPAPEPGVELAEGEAPPEGEAPAEGEAGAVAAAPAAEDESAAGEDKKKGKKKE